MSQSIAVTMKCHALYTIQCIGMSQFICCDAEVSCHALYSIQCIGMSQFICCGAEVSCTVYYTVYRYVTVYMLRR